MTPNCFRPAAFISMTNTRFSMRILTVFTARSSSSLDNQMFYYLP